MMLSISLAENKWPVRGTMGSAVAMEGGIEAVTGDTMATSALSAAKEDARPPGPAVPEGVVAAVEDTEAPLVSMVSTAAIGPSDVKSFWGDIINAAVAASIGETEAPPCGVVGALAPPICDPRGVLGAPSALDL
jgi:hypothetical protein